MYELNAADLVSRWSRILLLVCGLIWIPLEGALWSVLLISGLSTAALLAAGHNRWLAGRRVKLTGLLLYWSGAGGAAALSWLLLTAVFMAVKTGLHAHGPEFSAAELSWLWHRLPEWPIFGALLGLGGGMIRAGWRTPPPGQAD